MTRSPSQPSKPDAPLRGQPPAPDELRDPSPHGSHPNASSHIDDKPQYHTRPETYPAAKHSKPHNRRS